MKRSDDNCVFKKFFTILLSRHITKHYLVNKMFTHTWLLWSHNNFNFMLYYSLIMAKGRVEPLKATKPLNIFHRCECIKVIRIALNHSTEERDQLGSSSLLNDGVFTSSSYQYYPCDNSRSYCLFLLHIVWKYLIKLE